MNELMDWEKEAIAAMADGLLDVGEELMDWEKEAIAAQADTMRWLGFEADVTLVALHDQPTGSNDRVWSDMGLVEIAWKQTRLI